MPILNEEPNLYPENLLEAYCPAPSELRWWVLYTKARQEKAVARELFKQQVGFYLPLVRKTSAARGRKSTSHVPLFAGYVFAYGTDEDRVTCLKTNRISRILTVDTPEQLVFDLQQFRQLIATEAPLTIESRLAPGNRVRVRQGPFGGLEGTVLLRRSSTRLLVSINFLQQGASVEIDDFLLEPIG